MTTELLTPAERAKPLHTKMRKLQEMYGAKDGETKRGNTNDDARKV